MRIYVNGVQQGGSAGIPGTPEEVLLDPSAPSTLVGLNSSGEGTSLSYSAVRSAISATPGATIADPMTGADWTETEASGTTATWAGGILTLSALAGTTGTVAVVHASAIDAGAQQWDLLIRIDVTQGDTPSRETSQASTITYQTLVDANNYVAIRLYSNGVLACYWNVNGSFTNSGSLSPAPTQAQRTGGQLWLRMNGNTAGRWVISWGVGVGGALPLNWQRVYTIDNAPLSGQAMASANMRLLVDTESTRVDNYAVEVLAIRSTWSVTL